MDWWLLYLIQWTYILNKKNLIMKIHQFIKIFIIRMIIIWRLSSIKYIVYSNPPWTFHGFCNFRGGPGSVAAKRQGGQGHHVVVSLRVALIGHSTLKGSWGDGLSRADIGWVLLENLNTGDIRKSLIFPMTCWGFLWFPINFPSTNQLSNIMDNNTR